jgi:myo-inositol 2-dehydrogenase / D-chiro-inositol 1-dehydrogenase
MEEKKGQSRRKFLSDVALGAIGAIGTAGLLTSCASSGAIPAPGDASPPNLLDRAPDGKVLKAGLIGCGGRGAGAAVNFVDAGPNLEIVALGDVFKDQLDKCRRTLKAARGIEIADDKCFTGFDNYEKVIDAGVDVVLLATPPHFRPMHVEAAINAGKHVFQEKPVAVDPVGARKMAEVTQKARQQNLCMVSGTIRRYHALLFIELF